MGCISIILTDTCNSIYDLEEEQEKFISTSSHLSGNTPGQLMRLNGF